MATLSDLMIRANAQAEATTSSSSSSSSLEPNWTYAKDKVVTEIYVNVATLDCGTKILVKELPLGFLAPILNNKKLLELRLLVSGSRSQDVTKTL